MVTWITVKKDTLASRHLSISGDMIVRRSRCAFGNFGFPENLLVAEDVDRVNFDEAMLPEDSWEGDLEISEYEGEWIMEGYDAPSWVDEADLSCGALLQYFDLDRVRRDRFEVMQSHEKEDTE
ncbi:unnamed protein product [Peronospora belbahrii]|uniref:Chromo domain-containing protein n=1 Tax=Peronospora belbahrii TaxID=622444 RepID=A0AAU9KQ10_9STRA|nr:unnamed protein product [Peronospora belbahrii]